VLKLPGGEWDIPSVVGFRKDGSVMLPAQAARKDARHRARERDSLRQAAARDIASTSRHSVPISRSSACRRQPARGADIVLASRGRQLTIVEACSHLLKLLQAR